MTHTPKQYRLKRPVTVALVADDDNEIVLRTEGNSLIFVAPVNFERDWEEIKDE